jgi:hypothetical protein
MNYRPLDPTVNTIETFDIPDEYRKIGEEDIVIVRRSIWNMHTNRNEGFILISTREMLKQMFRAPWVGSDGNFKQKVDIFVQLYLFAFRKVVGTERHSFVGAYALLTHKTEFLYTYLFNALKSLAVNIQGIQTEILWRRCTMDDEPAAKHAFENIFGIAPDLCHFHLFNRIIAISKKLACLWSLIL